VEIPSKQTALLLWPPLCLEQTPGWVWLAAAPRGHGEGFIREGGGRISRGSQARGEGKVWEDGRIRSVYRGCCKRARERPREILGPSESRKV